VAQSPAISAQAGQDAVADIGEGVVVVEEGEGDLFVEGEVDVVDGPLPSRSSSEQDVYLVEGGPSFEALRARVPLLRAQVVGFLEELDDFHRHIPPRKQNPKEKK
jgi:hypothetical protein